jgi:hypothetical protein
MTGGQACATLRPGWDGTPATALSEALALLLSPMGLFVGAALAVAVLFRHALGVTLAAVIWAFFLYSLVGPDPGGIRAEAMAEGCMAPPTLFIGLSTAICALAVIYVFRRETRPQ